MRVSLFATCLVDQFRPEAATAAVAVLRHAGCTVEFDPRQTCCGQPAFNSGYQDEARKVGRHFLEVFADAEAVVAPSGSCVAMIRHLPHLFEAGSAEHARAVQVAGRTHEFGSFLVHVLGVTELGARFDGRVSWHDACHGLRDLGIRDEPRRLIAAVEGCELVEMNAADSCCGFGGTFSVKFPEISVAMLDRKLEELRDSGVDAVVSGDASCLMQIEGRMQRLGLPIRGMHLAELLAHGAGAARRTA